MSTIEGVTPAASAGMLRGTGRDRADWFALLDGEPSHTGSYRDIFDLLHGEHGLSKWWAQKIAVEYEQARGLRVPGARRDGTFTVTVSKSVAAPADRLVAAFSDPDLREQWLPGVVLHERSSQPGRSARFDCEGDQTRVNISYAAKDGGRCELGLEHERLPDADVAAERKEFWRERLGVLKALLEE